MAARQETQLRIPSGGLEEGLRLSVSHQSLDSRCGGLKQAGCVWGGRSVLGSPRPGDENWRGGGTDYPCLRRVEAIGPTHQDREVGQQRRLGREGWGSVRSQAT